MHLHMHSRLSWGFLLNHQFDLLHIYNIYSVSKYLFLYSCSNFTDGHERERQSAPCSGCLSHTMGSFHYAVGGCYHSCGNNLSVGLMFISLPTDISVQWYTKRCYPTQWLWKSFRSEIGFIVTNLSSLQCLQYQSAWEQVPFRHFMSLSS